MPEARSCSWMPAGPSTGIVSPGLQDHGRPVPSALELPQPVHVISETRKVAGLKIALGATLPKPSPPATAAPRTGGPVGGLEAGVKRWADAVGDGVVGEPQAATRPADSSSNNIQIRRMPRSLHGSAARHPALTSCRVVMRSVAIEAELARHQLPLPEGFDLLLQL